MSAKNLPVPYFIQPTPNTCQSTCLKMMSVYIERQVTNRSLSGESLDIMQIQNELKNGPEKGSHLAHANFKWWLLQRFPSVGIEYLRGLLEVEATARVVASLDANMPVMVSVSHQRTHGHIVLVVGYEDYQPGCSSDSFRLVMHDPAGRFDPFFSRAVNKYVGAASLPDGSEYGPGRGCRVPINAISRRRENVVELFTLMMPTKLYCD